MLCGAMRLTVLGKTDGPGSARKAPGARLRFGEASVMVPEIGTFEAVWCRTLGVHASKGVEQRIQMPWLVKQGMMGITSYILLYLSRPGMFINCA